MLTSKHRSPAVGTQRPARTCHPRSTVVLHWSTVAAIVVAVAAMWLRDAIDDSTARSWLLNLHRQLGVLVLLAAAVRIVSRLKNGLADHAVGMSRMMSVAAKAAHGVLYGLLLVLPISGWVLTNAHGLTLSILGVLPLPHLLPADSELADTLSDYHIWLAWGLLVVVAVHAGAALWHHFVRRDGVLLAMLPASRTRNASADLVTGADPATGES